MNPEQVQHYEVVPGLLLAGEYPAARDPALAMRRVGWLLERGVEVFVDLTTRRDRLEPYADLLAERGAERHSFPIPDLGVPEDDEVMRGVLATIEAAMRVGRTCYVHCWGGIGRTGTAVGCFLRGTGLDGDTALARVQHLYSTHMPKFVDHPYSPQTRPQSDYVRNWNPGGS